MRRYPPPTLGTCPTCGKVAYTSRAAARRSRRNLYPGQHMEAYQCTTGWWHIGPYSPTRRTQRQAAA